jgi:hypothetical protein
VRFEASHSGRNDDPQNGADAVFEFKAARKRRNGVAHATTMTSMPITWFTM